jgi:hypothetical protein
MSNNLVPYYMDADLARTLDTLLKPRPRPSLALGTQITCFTSTKVQILTHKRCAAASGWWARTFRHRACEKSARRFRCPRRRRSSSSTWKKGKKKLQRARFPPASACCCGDGRDDGETPQVPHVCMVCVVEYYVCVCVYIYNRLIDRLIDR